MSEHISVEEFPPAEYVREAMESLGWNQSDLAEAMGCDRRAVSRLIDGHVSITSEIAYALAVAFDTSETVWENLQHSYELSLAARK